MFFYFLFLFQFFFALFQLLLKHVQVFMADEFNELASK